MTDLKFIRTIAGDIRRSCGDIRTSVAFIRRPGETGIDYTAFPFN